MISGAAIRVNQHSSSITDSLGMNGTRPDSLTGTSQVANRPNEQTHETAFDPSRGNKKSRRGFERATLPILLPRGETGSPNFLKVVFAVRPCAWLLMKKQQPAHVRLARALYGPPHLDGLSMTQAQLRAWVLARCE